MLTHFTLDNFKAIRHLDLDLMPLTAFIGPNDSGKSSILQALRYASQVATGWSLVEIFVGDSGLSHLCTQDTDRQIQVSMEGSIPNGTDFAWSFQLDGAAEDQRMLRHERCVIDGQDKGGGNQLPHSQLRQQTPALSRTLEATVLLQFDLDRLKRPSYFDEGTPQLQAGGYGLPSVLATMQGLVRERFEELERRFVAMVPTMQRILIGPGPVFRKETETIRIDDQAVTRLVDRRYTGHHLFFDTVSGQRIPAAQASDGSVILLGYLAVLLSDPPPHLVLIEEPEHGIHPQALGPLIQFFRDCLTANADLQILMTSHSPYLVDHLKPDEVVLTRRNEEGYTEAATLKDLPDVERWLENLSPGELWTMGGEDDLIQRIRQGGGDG